MGRTALLEPGDGSEDSRVEPSIQKSPFGTDEPVLDSIVLCDSVAMIFGAEKPILVGVFEVVYANVFPVIIPGSIVVAISGIKETPIDLRFEIVGYDENPLGIKQTVGVARVEPPSTGITAGAFVTGMLLFPVKVASIVDIEVWGNGVRMGSKPISVVDIGPQEAIAQ